MIKTIASKEKVERKVQGRSYKNYVVHPFQWRASEFRGSSLLTAVVIFNR